VKRSNLSTLVLNNWEKVPSLCRNFAKCRGKSLFFDKAAKLRPAFAAVCHSQRAKAVVCQRW
jgi:hypothetical protein